MVFDSVVFSKKGNEIGAEHGKQLFERRINTYGTAHL